LDWVDATEADEADGAVNHIHSNCNIAWMQGGDGAVHDQIYIKNSEHEDKRSIVTLSTAAIRGMLAFVMTEMLDSRD
jgi:hypothetical protein